MSPSIRHRRAFLLFLLAVCSVLMHGAVGKGCEKKSSCTKCLEQGREKEGSCVWDTTESKSDEQRCISVGELSDVQNVNTPAKDLEAEFTRYLEVRMPLWRMRFFDSRFASLLDPKSPHAAPDVRKKLPELIKSLANYLYFDRNVLTFPTTPQPFLRLPKGKTGTLPHPFSKSSTKMTSTTLCDAADRPNSETFTLRPAYACVHTVYQYTLAYEYVLWSSATYVKDWFKGLEKEGLKLRARDEFTQIEGKAGEKAYEKMHCPKNRVFLRLDEIDGCNVDATNIADFLIKNHRGNFPPEVVEELNQVIGDPETRDQATRDQVTAEREVVLRYIARQTIQRYSQIRYEMTKTVLKKTASAINEGACVHVDAVPQAVKTGFRLAIRRMRKQKDAVIKAPTPNRMTVAADDVDLGPLNDVEVDGNDDEGPRIGEDLYTASVDKADFDPPSSEPLRDNRGDVDDSAGSGSGTHEGDADTSE